MKVDGELVGFALINNFLEINIPTDKTMYEFFITYPFQRKGIGRQTAYQIFKQFCGSWQLKYHPQNKSSEKFWNKIVSEIDSNYKIITNEQMAIYLDGTIGQVLLFESH
ncbi:MAG: hypothetical protein FWH31_02710 [Streptococcaceae bacterium]|nr:hypothetical protein [Streptococcaceae bacterium]